MTRSWHIWIAFGLCLAIVFGAMGWTTWTVLRLDRAQINARREAAMEETVRLALWRMDSALTTLVSQEGVRPYFVYSAFYPAERAYTRMFAEIEQGEVLFPSPLLAQESPYILLHFQLGPDGSLTSPQVPTGNMLDLAEAGYVTYEEIEAAERRLAQMRSSLTREMLADALAPSTVRSTPAARIPEESGQQKEAAAVASSQTVRNTIEYQARVQQRADVTPRTAQRPVMPLSEVSEEVMRPLWIGSELVLARRVLVNGHDYFQGCWLDWPSIKEWLLTSIEDLLPEADLAPLTSESSDNVSRMLASLPIRLVPGTAPAEATGAPSPIRLSLLIAWGFALLGSAAVAAVLLMSVSLGERRRAFVSAVTHEMRTPLTTFRMYTEMLAGGMVPEEEKQRHYLDTLRIEADRLSHLVQNVLAYARLEGRRGIIRLETMALKELLNRVKDRLQERAEQAGMSLLVESEDESAAMSVRIDASAVEQILFNLVDNACKYSSSASSKVIHLEADRNGSVAVLRVRDHGPGVAGKDVKRIFRPFCKSARDAANSAPGVGLGLALSRRLARSMGGNLDLARDCEPGACFVLSLPLS